MLCYKVIMFRKILNISVVMLLLLATVGISVNIHFCNGELKNISLFKSSKSCCGEGCNSCHNEVKVIKITDNFIASDFQIEPAKVLLLNLLAFHTSDIIYNTNVSFYNQMRILYPPPITFLNNSSPSFLQNFRC